MGPVSAAGAVQAGLHAGSTGGATTGRRPISGSAGRSDHATSTWGRAAQWSCGWWHWWQWGDDRSGSCSNYGAPPQPEWQNSTLRRMWSIAFSIMSPERSAAWPPSIIHTRTARSARQRSRRGGGRVRDAGQHCAARARV